MPVNHATFSKQWMNVVSVTFCYDKNSKWEEGETPKHLHKGCIFEYQIVLWT